MKILGSSESGSAIIGVLFASALFALVSAFYYTGTNNNLKARAIVLSKEQYSAIELALISEINGILREIDESNCLRTKSLENRPFGYGERSRRLDYFAGLRREDQDVGFYANIYERCARPAFIASGDISNPNHNHLYFCLAVNKERQEGKPDENFIVEFGIDFLSTSTGNTLSCLDFQRDRSGIARVAYGIHFADEVKTVKYGMTIIKSEIED